MSKCPECGREPPAPLGSNSEGEILIRVPERDYALFRKLFWEMETRLGMYGHGDLANRLKPYGQNFRQDWDNLRYFDDAALATASVGLERGFQAEVRLGEMSRDRRPVDIDFTLANGDIRTLRVSDCAPPPAADWFKSYFEGLAERITPLSETDLNQQPETP